MRHSQSPARPLGPTRPAALGYGPRRWRRLPPGAGAPTPSGRTRGRSALRTARPGPPRAAPRRHLRAATPCDQEVSFTCEVPFQTTRIELSANPILPYLPGTFAVLYNASQPIRPERSGLVIERCSKGSSSSATLAASARNSAHLRFLAPERRVTSSHTGRRRLWIKPDSPTVAVMYPPMNRCSRRAGGSISILMPGSRLGRFPTGTLVIVRPTPRGLNERADAVLLHSAFRCTP
jgi:hypothetical protein